MSTKIRFEPFGQIIALTEICAGFQNIVRQWIEESGDALFAFRQQLADGFADAERFWNEEEAEAFAVLAQGGWLGLERYFSRSQTRLIVQLCKGKGESAMNDAILGYFNSNDYALLASMSKEWVRVPYLRDRQPIVQDALSAHKAGQFTLSIPSLLPLAEGLAAEILGTNGTNAVRAMAADWKFREADAWAQEFCNVVEQVIYKHYTFGKDPAPYLNRHGILHGRVRDYASDLNSTRVFLLIDAIADLWRTNQQ
jgi:hypothetical protein